MGSDISRSDAFEIKDLAPGKDGGEDLVFFSCSKNENGMCRRLLQCFEKCIECIGAEHVHLIDDVYFVFSSLWCKTDLFYQVTDIINRIVACSIEFMDIKRGAIVEGLTGIACIAGLAIFP